MTTSDWINLGATIAVVVGIFISLFLGLKSLRQTRDLQKRAYINRMLDDILDWVMDIVRSPIEIVLPNLTDILDKEKKSIILLIFLGLALKLDLTQAKSKYIAEIVKECHLRVETFTDAMDSLNKVSKALKEGITTGNIERIQKEFAEYIKPESNLRLKLEALVTEIATLKSQNRG